MNAPAHTTNNFRTAYPDTLEVEVDRIQRSGCTLQAISQNLWQAVDRAGQVQCFLRLDVDLVELPPLGEA